MAVVPVLAVVVAAVVVAPDAVVFTDGLVLLATRVVDVPELEDASRLGFLPLASWMPMYAPEKMNMLAVSATTLWRMRLALRRIAARRWAASARALIFASLGFSGVSGESVCMIISSGW